MKLLDLFCGAGGAAMGYFRAGFTEIVGVDIKAQPRYPFEFVKADALDVSLAGFDAIHASPTCQQHSRTRKILEGKGIQPRGSYGHIEAIRARLLKSRTPWVIENVPGAPLRHPIALNGPMFGLRVIRKRLFESSELLLTPDAHQPSGGTNSHRGYSRGAAFVTVGGHNYNFREGKAAMGIDWMNRDELNEAIPPAYTEYIGKQLLQALAHD